MSNSSSFLISQKMGEIFVLNKFTNKNYELLDHKNKGKVKTNIFFTFLVS